MNQDEAIDTVKRYWRSTEEMRELRLHILFHDDMTGKLILPETSVYSGDATDDTLAHLGNVTRPLVTKVTQKLPALKIKTLKIKGKK